jgi:hypothetical protein
VAQRRAPAWLTLGLLVLVAWLGAGAGAAARQPFDHTYAGWDRLLRQHVQWLPDGVQSRVDYAGVAADRARLKTVLDGMSAVTSDEFERWTRQEQMAFFINAYNAFTIELILTAWPRIDSIRDLGSLLRSPWRRPFFTLLGARRHLDWVEHEQLRPRYAEPRVHAAVNCAAIGCPALRPEAFVAARLDAQLDDSMRRFLADRTRNRVSGGRLEVSAIFRWYRTDFEQGRDGVHGVEGFLARYADALTDVPRERVDLQQRTLRVTYLPYDWSLNARGR